MQLQGRLPVCLTSSAQHVLQTTPHTKMQAKDWTPKELPWPSFMSTFKRPQCVQDFYIFIWFREIQHFLSNPSLEAKAVLGYYNIISLLSDGLSSKDIGFRAVLPLAECRRNHIYNTKNSSVPVLLKPRLHSAFGKIKFSSNFSQCNGIEPQRFSGDHAWRPLLSDQDLQSQTIQIVFCQFLCSSTMSALLHNKTQEHFSYCRITRQVSKNCI